MVSYDNPYLNFKPKKQKLVYHNSNNNNNDSTATNAVSDGAVRVTLHNGQVLQADAVVCTVPLGVLQSKSITFDPPLPPKKQQAIDSLGCGLLNKCALVFPHVFWQDAAFLGVCQPNQPYLILNGHAITQKPVLVFMYGGQQAQDMEDLSDEDVVLDCLQVLKKMHPPSSTSGQVPPVIDYVVTRWKHDPMARMSFSYVPPLASPDAMQVLSEPILNTRGDAPVLLFAGEHTTPYHPSTMHGAYLTGIREAYRLDVMLEPSQNPDLPGELDPAQLYERTFSMKQSDDDDDDEVPTD